LGLAVCVTIIAGMNYQKIIYSYYNAKAFFSPPKDSARLSNGTIDLSRNGAIYQFNFKCNNPGIHDVRIISKKFTIHTYYSKDRYIPKFRLKVEFYDNEHILMTRFLKSDDYDPFIARDGTGGGGYSLISFKCPDDLPINKLITCKITVIEPDPYFNDSYSPVELRVT